MNRRVGYVCLGAASIALPLSFVGPAWSAQVVTISAISSPNDLLKFSPAASATSTITVTTAGVVSIAGGGTQLGTTPTVTVLVTVNCANGGAACSSGANGKINPVSGTGRLLAPTTFNVGAGSVTPTGTAAASLTFTLPSLASGTSTFKVGMSLPLDANTVSSSGTATYGVGLSKFQVLIAAGATAPTAGTVSVGTLTATAAMPLSISKVADLAFGTIVRPNSGSGSATIDSASGGLTLSNAFTQASTHSRAVFVIAGDAGVNLNISLPTSMVMTVSTLASLAVTLLPSTSGVLTMSGAVGSASTLSLGVGGSMALSTGTVAGHYTGTFTVSVNYQ